MSYTTDAARWRALTLRDANANGHFIYSVKSTNIYCRPTCPGRLARRANVGFYATWREAEAAGFRACKRCKPNSTGVLEEPQERAVKKACELIEEALESGDAAGAAKLEQLARKVGLTPRYFHKVFKDRMGLTPKEYATKRAVENSRGTDVAVAKTTTETSTPLLGWEDFEVDGLVDFGPDANIDILDTGDLAAVQDQSLVTDANLELDMDGLFQPWSNGYEPAQIISWPVGCDNRMTESLGITTADMSYEKTVSYISTLEQDAAALLSCDNLTNLLQGQLS